MLYNKESAGSGVHGVQQLKSVGHITSVEMCPWSIQTWASGATLSTDESLSSREAISAACKCNALVVLDETPDFIVCARLAWTDDFGAIAAWLAIAIEALMET